MWRFSRTSSKWVNNLLWSTSLRRLTDIGSEKILSLTTCSKVYSAPRTSFLERILFKRCPKNGINLEVTYFDSKPEASNNTPIVVAVHGAPGTYEDYSGLVREFTSKGYRFICPNFPDMKYTFRTWTFRQTTEEKSEFLSDFLTAINIPRVDVIIAHSSGVYPTLELWKQNPDIFKSIVLVNAGAHRTMKVMKQWSVTIIAWMNLHPLGRKLFLLTGIQERLRQPGGGTPSSSDAGINSLHSITTMFLARVDRLLEITSLMKTRQTPTLYVYSEADKLIEPQAFKEMVRLLGADVENTTFVSRDGNIKRKPSSPPPQWLRVFNVEGGHYAYKSYTSLIVNEVEKMLRR